ncbi:MAG: hypothetical protein IJS94_08350, partial [Clostridia bacterium]|nr:hypothetical protein [Clostridia bacterium]
MKIRFLSLFLCFVMLAGMLPAGLLSVPALAEDLPEVPNVVCRFNNGLFVITCDGVYGAKRYTAKLLHYNIEEEKYKDTGYSFGSKNVSDEEENEGSFSWWIDKNRFYKSENGKYDTRFAVEVKAINSYGETIAYTLQPVQAPFERYLDVPANGYLSGTGMLYFDKVDGAALYDVEMRYNSNLIAKAENITENYYDLSKYVREGDEYWITVTAKPPYLYQDLCESYTLFRLTYSADTSLRYGGTVEVNDDRTLTYTGYLDFLNKFDPGRFSVQWMAFGKNNVETWNFISESEKYDYDPSFLAVMVSAEGHKGNVISADNTYTNPDMPYVATSYDRLKSFFNRERDTKKTVYIKLGCDMTVTDDAEQKLETNGADIALDLGGYTLSYTDTQPYNMIGTTNRFLISGANGRVTVNDTPRYDSAKGEWVRGNIEYLFKGKITIYGSRPFIMWVRVLDGDVTVNSGTIRNKTEKSDHVNCFGYYGSGLIMNDGILDAYIPAMLYLGAEPFGIYGGTLRSRGGAGVVIDAESNYNDGAVFPIFRNCRIYNESDKAQVRAFSMDLPRGYFEEHGESAARSYFDNCLTLHSRIFIDGVEKSSSSVGAELEHTELYCNLYGPYFKSRYEIKVDVSLDGLYLTVTEPEYGMLPDYTIGGGGDLYDFEFVWQYEETPGNFTYMSPTKMFRTGVTYRAYITIYPKFGVIDEGLGSYKTVKINGKGASHSGRSYWADFKLEDSDYYDVYIGHIRIGKKNRSDVLGDGGSVQYFEAGEYSATDFSFDYGAFRPTLVLENFSFNINDYYRYG